MAKNLLTEELLEPLDGATSATINIDVGDGNLTINRLFDDEPLLAGGTLEYLENQGLPLRSRDEDNGRLTFSLRAGRSPQPWLHLPWATCNGATEWRIHLNPAVPTDLTAHSAGGNIQLDLTDMTITRLSSYTGGGNLSVVLPDRAEDLSVAAKSGAGNVSVAFSGDITGNNTVSAESGAGTVVVRLPVGVAACIHAEIGLGKAVIDPCFPRLDKHTYQSPGFGSAAHRVELTLKSGAGNVIVAAAVPSAANLAVP